MILFGVEGRAGHLQGPSEAPVPDSGGSQMGRRRYGGSGEGEQHGGSAGTFPFPLKP